MFWFFFSELEPMPADFDVKLASQFKAIIKTSLVPAKETNRNGRVTTIDRQYGIVKFSGEYFTVIAYRKAFDFPHEETYHTLIVNDNGRYYSVTVDVPKLHGRGKASFYPPHKSYSLQKMCFVDDTARKEFESSEEW